MGSESTNFTSLTETQEVYANIDTAYEHLRTNRESMFTDGHLPELTETDKLCNHNLQTVYLFKTLNDTAASLNDKIRSLVDDSKVLDESVSKNSVASTNFTGLCNRYYYPTEFDTFKTLSYNLSNEYSKIKDVLKKKIELDRLNLETELDAVNVKLNGLRALIKTGIEGIIKPDDMIKKMCAVCYEREVCMVMVPCGHTYCDQCSKYDYRSKCPQCRATINSRVKMYFSI